GRVVRACAMNGSDGSQATTDAGSQTSQMADVSAPAPQPPSSQLAAGVGCSHSTKPRATSRLQRPMYASYASPATHLSPGAFVMSTLWCPPNDQEADLPNPIRAACVVAYSAPPAHARSRTSPRSADGRRSPFSPCSAR